MYDIQVKCYRNFYFVRYELEITSKNEHMMIFMYHMHLF